MARSRFAGGIVFCLLIAFSAEFFLRLLMVRFSKALVLVIVVVVGSYFIFKKDPPAYTRHIVIPGSLKPVKDSMRVLRQICEEFRPYGFMNCVVAAHDSTMTFNVEQIGKFDSVTTSNKAFVGLKKEDVRHMLSLMSFLRDNRISGVYHDSATLKVWLFPYGELFGDTNFLYIWNSPQDTLTANFRRDFKIIDRRENVVLVSLSPIY